MKKTDIELKITGLFVVMIVVSILLSCGDTVRLYEPLTEQAAIYPEYTATVIPYNIAPLNFMIREEASLFVARFAVAGKDSFEVVTKSKVIIPSRKWKRLLSDHRGEQLIISIFAKKSTGWVRFGSIRFTIASEPIDPYIAYRLIEPGYEGWEKMGIFQRCLENFEESPIIHNRLTGNSCMNCHSFCQNNPHTFLFHLRQQHAGTVFLKDGQLTKVNTRAQGMISAGVYPRWHPDGRYVAFSVNNTRQGFHTSNDNKVEVYDKASDIVIYDTETRTVFTDNLLCNEGSFETFPEWSPDGKYLIFCSAPAHPMPQQYDTVKYDLIRIPFDVVNGRFGTGIDTLVSSAKTGKSVSLARISPDGKYIVFCMSAYGTFPVWHRDNDLYLLHVETGEIRNLTAMNSAQSDSYHSWSTNGRWIIFGSRRMDGTYTRLYISYFDHEGKEHPPFLLPQKDPQYYDFSLKSYNIPEFITGKVEVSPYKLAETAKKQALEIKNLLSEEP